MASDPRPGYNLVKDAPLSPQGSMRDAARPWAALEGVGENISKVGDQMARVFVQSKEVEIRRQAAEMELEYDQIKNDFELNMLKDPNVTPESANAGWMSATEQFAKKWKDNPNYSQAQKDVLGMRSQELLQQGRGQMLKTATIANIGNMKTMAALLLKQGEDQLDPEKQSRAIELMRPIIGDAAAETVAYDSNQKMEKNILISDVVADPFGTKEFMSGPKPEHLTDQVWQDAKSARNSEENLRLNTGADNFGDMVAQKIITTDTDIDKHFGEKAPPETKLPPRIVAKMKSSLATLMEERAKGLSNNPAYQRQVLGEVTSGLNAIDTTSPNAMEKKVELLTKINLIADGPTKTESIRLVQDKFAGAEEDYKNQAEVVRASLKQTFAANMDAETTAQMPLNQAIMDGFYKKDRLIGAGFSEEQATKIADIYNPNKETKKGTDRAKLINEQIAKVQELWDKRENKESTLSPWEDGVIQATLANEKTVKVVNQQNLDAYHQRLGDAIKGMNDWMRRNPNDLNDPVKVAAAKVEILRKVHASKNSASMSQPKTTQSGKTSDTFDEAAAMREAQSELAPQYIPVRTARPQKSTKKMGDGDIPLPDQQSGQEIDVLPPRQIPVR